MPSGPSSSSTHYGLGLDFVFFSIQSRKATLLLMNKEDRVEPFVSIIAHSVKFLGGMNLALAVLSLMCIIFYENLLASSLGIGVIACLGLAHFSQFWFNLPIAIQERKGESTLWSVLRGTMRMIFITDLVLAVANLILALSLYWIF